MALVPMLIAVVTAMPGGVPLRQGASNATAIPNAAKCGRCRIVLAQVMPLGSRDTGLVEYVQAAAVDGRGNYVLLQPNHGEVPIIFGPDGRFKTKVGRKGQGPGEFTAAAHVSIDDHDTLFVADWTGRMSVFAPEGRRYVRSFIIPPSARASAVLTDRSIVLNSSVDDKATAGMAFHLYRPDGYRFAATGDSTTPYLPSTDIFFIHRLARSSAGGFWSLRLMGEYRIERWDVRGGRLAYLTRAPEWYVGLPARLRGVDTNALDPPPSQALAIWEDPVGLLWTMILVGDSNRSRAKRSTRESSEGKLYAYNDVDAAWDTMVEVIDTRDGQLVASRRFDIVLDQGLGRGGLVLHTVERADGLYEARVVRLSLELR